MIESLLARGAALEEEVQRLWHGKGGGTAVVVKASRLRDTKELTKINGDRPETVAWAEALGSLYREAKGACAQLAGLPPEHRARASARRRKV